LLQDQFTDFQKKWTRRPLEHKYRENAFERMETAATMSGGSSRQVLRQLNTLFHCGVAGPLGDEELLEQFVAGSEEVAEAAFATLVDRHGAMVLGVCRRVLGNRHAAEDAFQATFLVLARKAPAIARREQLASWLYGVARRAAMDARARAARQHATEKRLGTMSPVERMDEIHTSELRSILDEELGRLPERHRAAIVLCELEGLSRREAARRLSVSEGTLSSRLARAKIRLRDRLTQRGLALSAAALASALAQDAQALNVPPSLVDSTIRGATLVATGSSLTGVASTAVITLTEGVLKAMLLSKLKFAFLGFVTVAMLTTGAGVVAQVPVSQSSDDDRLKSVERKLDRLLEAIGGTGRHAPPVVSDLRDSRPEPTAPVPGIAPSVDVASGPTVIASVPRPPQPPMNPNAQPPVAVAAVPPTQVLPPAAPQAAPLARSNSLAGRVDMLEQRLANLERRLADFERRLGRTSSDALPPAQAPMVTDIPRADVALPAPRTVIGVLPSPDALPAPAPPAAPAPIALPAAAAPASAAAHEPGPAVAAGASPDALPSAGSAPESPADTPPPPG
jgi:RNA polymerase sigma-70 factor (ECF subfamily)